MVRYLSVSQLNWIWIWIYICGYKVFFPIRAHSHPHIHHPRVILEPSVLRVKASEQVTLEILRDLFVWLDSLEPQPMAEVFSRYC